MLVTVLLTLLASMLFGEEEHLAKVLLTDGASKRERRTGRFRLLRS